MSPQTGVPGALIAEPGSPPWSPAGDDPSRVLEPPADPLPEAGAGRAARDRPPLARGDGVRDRRGTPAVLLTRRGRPDHRRGRPEHPVRDWLPGTPGAARWDLA